MMHIKLVYFKETGKYYSEGELNIPRRDLTFHEGLNILQDKLNAGERPGLVDGMDFDVLATVYTEFGPLQYLFVRDEDGYVGQRSLRVSGEDE